MEEDTDNGGLDKQLGSLVEKHGFAVVARSMLHQPVSVEDLVLLAKTVASAIADRSGPVSERHPLAVALESMTLEERRDALDRHYAAREKNTWTMAKGIDPTPKIFLDWLDVIFPDRREIGMVLSDLKYLDKPAYRKFIYWSGEGSSVPPETIESFGLPTKVTPYDPVHDANAPKSQAEVYARAARGEDSIKNLRRAYARTYHHRPK